MEIKSCLNQIDWQNGDNYNYESPNLLFSTDEVKIKFQKDWFMTFYVTSPSECDRGNLLQPTSQTQAPS